MSETHTFTAVIRKVEGGGAYVEVPFDVEAAFGKKRVPVVATIDGEPYRGSLVRMGGECHVLGVLKDIQAKVGKGPGDAVEITLQADEAPRKVEVPADLKAALIAAPAASEAFDGLAYSHKREYVRWIEEAKREATRAERVAKTVERVSEGKKLR